MCIRKEKWIEAFGGNSERGRRLEVLSVIWILLLQWILKTSVERASTGLIWLRVRKSGGMLRSLCFIFGFHKMWKMSSIAKELLVL